ncbi:MAG: SDR family oxidoreductase [Chloroflexi bacterium]|jgi:NAD(P)-dependent dehydrogenase (short-subunit alcohol dehydrogenase family)|nr:SDR family oxidoreductase [Chloroflexota bacterium]
MTDQSNHPTATLDSRWALILGASSGFGAATARALARAGMHIVGVHLDPRSTLDRAQAVIADIEAEGRRAEFFNTNAAEARRRARVIRKIKDELGDAPLHLMVHTLAFGSLRPFIINDTDDPGAATTESQMEMTLRVMAHSLVYWTQDLVRAELLARGSRIYALSSIGSQRASTSYGAVSAAKAALESHARQLALELGPRGIAVNCLLPGVTDTPALRAIPGHEKIVATVREHHPAGRLTTPEDVAQALVTLADPRLTWISGAVIPVDGGESIVGIG